MTVVVTNYSGAALDAPSLTGLPLVNAYDMEAGLPGFRFLVPRWVGLHRALARADADLYYVRVASAAAGQTAYFCRRRNRGFVFGTSSDSDTDPRRVRLNLRDHRLYRWALGRADRVVTQHTGQQETMLRTYGRSSVVIGGIAQYVSEPPGRPDSPPVVLWLGNYRALKQPEMFLALAAEFPEARFEMVGGVVATEPHLFHRVRDQARALSNVVFHGPAVDPRPFLARAWVLVNTSRLEGYPTSFLEAWAYGVPSLSFVDPGGDVTRHRVGIVASTPDDLRDGLRSFLSNPEARNEMGRRARELVVREHHPRVIGDRYERLFREVLEERRGRERAPQP